MFKGHKEPGTHYGKFRAVCKDVHDPEQKGRIRVYCPPIYGEDWSDWAYPNFPPNYFNVPPEGSMVWVEFEGGDPEYPIWTGCWYNKGQSPWQTTHVEPRTDPSSGAIIDKDKLDHEPHPIDHVEHRALGQHPPYYDPEITGHKSEKGGYFRFSDEPGNEFFEIVSPPMLKYNGAVAGLKVGSDGIELYHPEKDMTITLDKGSLWKIIKGITSQLG